MKILFVTSIYRTGKNTYPILKPLSLRHDLSIFFVGQMNKSTPWFGTSDPRPKLYSFCKENNLPQHHSPEYGEISRDIIYKMLQKIEAENFDLVLFDDNRIVKDMGSGFIYDYLKDRGIKMMACPHGNNNYDWVCTSNKLKLFVFGPKDVRSLNCDKSKLICGGIPENDALRNYKHKPEHILFIVSNISLKYKTLLGFRCFTPQIIKETGVFDLAKSEGCEVIIKCKSRYPHKKQTIQDFDCLSDLPATMVFDAPDEEELISKSKYVISCCSTLIFKPIQMGIPTVILRDFGSVGSLVGFSGLCSPDEKSILSTLERQVNEGKQTEFIEDTLTGGLDFNSTEYYLSAIEEYLNDTE